jgi:hypothetical protein
MADATQPNILVIWGDDIGITNLSAYSDGLMGYRTPNIDRIADEGMRFTDSYGEQSCTAGRSSFITGQSVFRTGLSKVGMPGLEYAHTGEHASLCLVVDHDDAEREYEYAGSSVTNPDAESIIDTASRLGWTVVSMRRDWNRVFAE